jgi:hypothetical protein
VWLLILQALVQVRAQECLLILGVRHFLLPAECREFLASSAPDSFNQIRIAMAGEVLEGRRFSVFFTHENHGSERREQSDSCRKFQSVKRYQSGQAISRRTVPYLIMILVVHHKS